MSRHDPSSASAVPPASGAALGQASGAPGSVRANTPLIWIFSLLPLTNLLSLLFAPSRDLTPDGLAEQNAVDFATSMIGLATYVISVVLAVRDHRQLVRAGVGNPFYWAWALLAGLVYAVGRAVVLRRSGRPAFGPMWLYIGCLALSVCVTLASILGR